MLVSSFSRTWTYYPLQTLKKRCIHNWNSKKWQILASTEVPESFLKDRQLFNSHFDKSQLLTYNGKKRETYLRKVLKFPGTATAINKKIEECQKIYKNLPSDFDRMGSDVKMFFGSDFIVNSQIKETPFEFKDYQTTNSDEFNILLENDFQNHIENLIQKFALKIDVLYDEKISDLFSKNHKFHRLFLDFMRVILFKAKDSISHKTGVNMSGFAFVEASQNKTIFLQMLTIFTKILFPNMISVYVDCAKFNVELPQLISTAAIQSELRTTGSTVDLILKSLQRQGYSVAFFADNICSAKAETWNSLHDMISDDKTFIALADSSQELFQLIQEGSGKLTMKAIHQKNPLNQTKIRPVYGSLL